MDKPCLRSVGLYFVAIAAHSFITVMVGSLIVIGAAADPLQSPQESEETALRQELERIVKDDPQKGAEARKTLEVLDQPASSSQGRQLRNRRERGARRIVNGIQTIRHSAVAAVLRGSGPTTATAWCTGTLVACDKVLTAAHCVAGDPSPKGYLAYFPTLGFFEVTNVTWLKDDYRFPYADLAMLTLAKSVDGIAPISLNTAASPINGSIGTIVGYGRTGGKKQDYGVKREGSVKFGSCQDRYADKKLLCWDFDADINVGTQDSNTCNADSGGGVFMLDKEGQRSVQRVVGVVSGGLDSDCVKGDHSYNTDVFQWRDWLAKSVDGKRSETCGATNIDIPKNFKSALVMLGPEKPEVKFALQVPPGTGSLRVAMNGEDDGKGKNDFDLLLFEGSDTASAACEQSGTGQFAFCQIEQPSTGPWTISLRRKKGEGAAQLTVTIVPAPAAR